MGYGISFQNKNVVTVHDVRQPDTRITQMETKRREFEKKPAKIRNDPCRLRAEKYG